MRDLYESHAACSEEMVLGIGHGVAVGIWFLNLQLTALPQVMTSPLDDKL